MVLGNQLEGSSSGETLSALSIPLLPVVFVLGVGSGESSPFHVSMSTGTVLQLLFRQPYC